MTAICGSGPQFQDSTVEQSLPPCQIQHGSRGLREGTTMDATLIAAPSSTKNRGGNDATPDDTKKPGKATNGTLA